MNARRFCLHLLASVLLCGVASAEPIEASDSVSLFGSATTDLEAGRLDESIARFESLADRDVHDAAASFNRGLAYAKRASSPSSKPGDLGQAACAFAEARVLAKDAALRKRITEAEASTQRELGRKLAAHGGGGALMEPPAPLGRQLVELMPPVAWSATAGLGSLLCLVAAGLYLTKRGGGTTHALAAVGLLAFGAGALAEHRAFTYRTTEDDACIITENATLFHDASFAARGEPLREGAHVKVSTAQASDAFVEVRWGSLTGYATPSSFRRLAHP